MDGSTFLALNGVKNRSAVYSVKLGVLCEPSMRAKDREGQVGFEVLEENAIICLESRGSLGDPVWVW